MQQKRAFLSESDVEKMAEEFSSRWRDRMAGMALMGMVLATDQKPEGRLKRAQEIMAMPSKVDKLLREMFQDALRIVHNAYASFGKEVSRYSNLPDPSDPLEERDYPF